jgi:hypothetical protein
MRAAKMGKRGRKKQTTTNPTSLRRSSPAFRSTGFVLRADCSTVAKVAKSMMGDHPYSSFPFSQGRQRDSIERRRGIKTIQGLSVFGRSASHVKKYPPKRRNRRRRKKRPMFEEAQKESVEKRNTPKQAPYDNMTPRRAASRF